jgi:hypothetical protein
MANLTVSVIVASEKVVEELREFYQFLKDRALASVIESAFYPALLNVWNGSAGWAEAFVAKSTHAQMAEYGGGGKAGAFFRAVVNRMEGEKAKEIVRQFASRGPPAKDGEWTMLAIIFERFPHHAEEFRAILGFEEPIFATIESDDMRSTIEMVVGHAVQEIPRSESSGTMETSGSEEHGFELQEAALSPIPDDYEAFSP